MTPCRVSKLELDDPLDSVVDAVGSFIYFLQIDSKTD